MNQICRYFRINLGEKPGMTEQISHLDCPQVQALHDYQAQQSDELSLVPGDVVNVLRKLPDGKKASIVKIS